jgi:replicative DNA helicase
MAPAVVRRISAWLEPADFVHQELGQAYGVAVSMAASDAPVDRIMVAAELRRSAPRVGWARLLAAAEEAVPVPAAASFYARQVVDAAVVRDVAGAGQQLVRLGRERPGGAARLLEAAIDELDGLTPVVRRFRQSRVGPVVSRVPEVTRGVVRPAAVVRERASR